MKTLTLFFVWLGHFDWRLVLEYLKVLLAWPPMAALIGFVFMARFKVQIGTFLDNARPKPPWVETLATQVVPVPAPVEQATDDGEGPAVGAADLGNGNSDIGADVVLSADSHKAARFRYLNQLLAFTTQILLDMLVDGGEVPLKALATFFRDFEPAQRQAMLTVLYQEGLATVESGVIRATEAAKEYAAWQERLEWIAAQQAVTSAPAGIEPFGAARFSPAVHDGRWAPRAWADFTAKIHPPTRLD